MNKGSKHLPRTTTADKKKSRAKNSDRTIPGRIRTRLSTSHLSTPHPPPHMPKQPSRQLASSALSSGLPWPGDRASYAGAEKPRALGLGHEARVCVEPAALHHRVGLLGGRLCEDRRVGGGL